LELPLDLPAYPLSSEARHGIYLVAKEALNNVMKHAHAKEVRLRVRQMGKQMEIEITDNGRGFEPDKTQSGRKGSGLQNMRARMEGLGGQFRVESTPGNGTRLTLTIQLDLEGK
jgi:signal transduction histidine kinase